MSSTTDGLILKGIGGFYYVKTAESILECRAKGIFRRKRQTPLAGDRVRVELGEDGSATVSEIFERINVFLRPALANVTRHFIVVSACDPKPNLPVLDELCAMSESNGVTPIFLLTKTDLEDAGEFARIYRAAGFEVIDVMANEGAALERIRQLAADELSVFSGNSGVGKSTLLNKLCPSLTLETNETSKKLGRGKHTTRAVELFEFSGGYVADTPGFSALDFESGAPIASGLLIDCFPDIAKYARECYFADCTHTVERGCSALAALREGKIEPTRHENYTALYKKAKDAEHSYN